MSAATPTAAASTGRERIQRSGRRAAAAGAAQYDPPGSRYGDPADLLRLEQSWRDFTARIQAEDAKKERSP